MADEETPGDPSPASDAAEQQAPAVEQSGASSSKPRKAKKKSGKKAEDDGDFDETVDAALGAANGDPVVALQALAEAICRKTGYNGKLGAAPVLYKTLQAQLARKGNGGVPPRLLDSRGSDELDASLTLTMSTARAPKSPGATKHRDLDTGRPRPSPYELPQHPPKRRLPSPKKTTRGHPAKGSTARAGDAADGGPSAPAAADDAAAADPEAPPAEEAAPERPATVPATSGATEAGPDDLGAPAADLVPPATAPAGEAGAKARKAHRAKSPGKGKAKSKASFVEKPHGKRAASRKGSPSKGRHGLDFLEPPVSPGRSTLESHHSRGSMRSRAMSAPVAERPRRGGQHDRHDRLGSTVSSQGGGSLLASRHRSRAQTAVDDGRLGASPGRGTAASDVLRETSVVDVRTWLKERRKKDARRERMLQSRVRRDERFLEMLDEKQAERNKLLQENEDRMAQNVAVAKAQKWKPVPFTPWPNEGKDKGDDSMAEDAAFIMDVERLFGDDGEAHHLQLLHIKPHWVTLGLGLVDEGRRIMAQQKSPAPVKSQQSSLQFGQAAAGGGGGGAAAGGGGGGGARDSMVARGGAGGGGN